ncbi:cap-specific mRNA (nucleoside-2'-O-)-methyltransferase 1-like [Chironomus tepperi]|uniref:cap-specific mRNA (nucleoside-2'-O-)-methyltransferase 1-like n=1 Tax=Chironomus tepperi TaxID=113505 RepID=UPI00391F3C40
MAHRFGKRPMKQSENTSSDEDGNQRNCEKQVTTDKLADLNDLKEDLYLSSEDEMDKSRSSIGDEESDNESSKPAKPVPSPAKNEQKQSSSAKRSFSSIDAISNTEIVNKRPKIIETKEPAQTKLPVSTPDNVKPTQALNYDSNYSDSSSSDSSSSSDEESSDDEPATENNHVKPASAANYANICSDSSDSSSSSDEESDDEQTMLPVQVPENAKPAPALNYGNNLSDSSSDEESDDESSQPAKPVTLPPTHMQKQSPSAKRSFSSVDSKINVEIVNKRPKIIETKTPAQMKQNKVSASVTKVQTQVKLPPSVPAVNYDNIYSGKSLKIMEKMGFKKEGGLGKSGQGTTELIDANQQKGRRGLGLKLDALDQVAIKWDPSSEQLCIPEKVDWIENNEPAESLLELSMDTLVSWVKRGPKKTTIENESKFCDADVLRNVLESKSVFDKLGADDMFRARTRSNPFETIRSNIFQNRAAVKMANIDSMFDFMFTNPTDVNGNSVLGKNDLLYFADVCAGPGGFSEYVLNRKKWEAKGFGFTLKADNDFKLFDFIAGTPETFTPFYGTNGDGNVYDPENLKSFENLILNQTESGVHFMMADGGFSVEGNENIQEILSKQMYLAQCLCALLIVKTNGHFVVKLFDLFTPFSVSLIYLMHKCFTQISICKPNTSRPANSERYLVCKWKKPFTDTIQRHLFDINEELFKQESTMNKDVLELVPFEVIKNDKQFFDYICNSNNSIGKNQTIGLNKIAAYCHDSTLVETRQYEIKQQCLKLWKLTDDVRRKPAMKSCELVCAELMESKWLKENFMPAPERGLESSDHLKRQIHSVLDWYFVGVDDIIKESKGRTFFMSRGRFDVYSYNMSTNNWESVENQNIGKLELPANTLIYGEIVKELSGENRSQIASNAFHIIDGIVIGGKDIRQLSLVERNQMCQKFVKALTKPQQSGDKKTIPVRCKKIFKLTDFADFFETLVPRRLKDRTEKLGYNVSHNMFHIPRGLLLLNEVRSDKMRCFSYSQKKVYYFDKNTKKTDFPENLQAAEMFASFKNTYTNRMIWKFEIRDQILERVEQSKKQHQYLYRDDFNNFIDFLAPKIN